ncbi:MAG: hypothetical protein V2A65_02600 [Candidatus Omnitrophota bacterium]
MFIRKILRPIFVLPIIPFSLILVSYLVTNITAAFCDESPWHNKVVFYDATYDTSWAFHPEILADYLKKNGFQVLNGAEVGQWMREKIEKGAENTVAVFTMGITPESVLENEPPEQGKRTIQRYLDNGGRVLWLGEWPFMYAQNDIKPQLFTRGEKPGGISWIDTSRLKYGEEEITPDGTAWGFVRKDNNKNPSLPVENVTTPLNRFWCEELGKYLTSVWFKNYCPQYPWSGLIYAFRADDLSEPEIQKQVYRLALYAGTPVEAPSPLPKWVAVPESPLKVTLDEPRNRRAFVRGETIPVLIQEEKKNAPGIDKVSLILKQGETVLRTEEHPWPADNVLKTAIPSADLACGDYALSVKMLSGNEVKSIREINIYLCPKPEPLSFFYGIWSPVKGNPARIEKMLQMFSESHINPGSCNEEDTASEFFDNCLRYGLRPALRLHGRAAFSVENQPEVFRKGPNGNFITCPLDVGKPSVGLIHPEVREKRSAELEKKMLYFSGYPAVLPYIFTNDDFQAYYGFDYSDIARQEFKKETGLEAPVPPEIAKADTSSGTFNAGVIKGPQGVIPDNDPWLLWCRFTTDKVCGGYNQALMEAKTRVFPDGRMGPLVGQWPWSYEGQYPPHMYGHGKFDLLSYYCYFQYWQPSIARLYFDNIVRMNNRDLPLCPTPDCAWLNVDEPSYYRNNFYLDLAGGATGMDFYAYSEVSETSWAECSRMGREIVGPFGPVIGRLRPVSAEISWLIPFAQYAHFTLYPLSQTYTFANLLGAHIDAEPICDEEVLSGYIKDKRAVLLGNIQWISQSVADALEKYVQNGGMVLLDDSTTLPIKGAKKIGVDLGMGDTPSSPDPKDPRFGSPGVYDYLIPKTVMLIKENLGSLGITPWADSPDQNLVIRRFEGNGVTYLWLVNIHTNEEFRFLRPRSNNPPMPGDEKLDLKEAHRQAKEYLTKKGAYGGRFRTTVSIPDGKYHPYDVLAGKKLDFSRADGQIQFQVDMERFGGTLIALYPEEVGLVKVLLPREVNRGGGGAEVVVTVYGKSGRKLAGIQPLSVTVTTPKGPWPEINGSYAAEGGVWRKRVSPAVNDPIGKWHVSVEELSSGQKIETSFEVK